jgi:hypothetical protein
MPVESYYEISQPRHVRLTTSAGEHTRYVRMLAQAAPYITSGQQVGAPRLGWKSPSLNAEARLIAPLWGGVNAFIPNRK